MHGSFVIVFYITWLGYQIAALAPRRFSYWVSVRMAELLSLLWVRKRRALEFNLTHVVSDASPGEVGRMVRNAFRNYGRFLTEFVLLSRLGRGTLLDLVEFPQKEQVGEALDSGRGVIFVTAHVGNWDLAAAVLAACGYPLHVIVDRFPNRRMNRFVQGTRAHLNVRTIDSGQTSPSMLRALKRGEMVAVLIDRPMTSGGVPVRFFGQTVWAPSGPARIALRTGALVIPGVLVRTKGGPRPFRSILDMDFRFDPTGDEQSDIRELTQRMMTAVERFIADHPDQWFMFRKFWGDAAPARDRHPILAPEG